jgi:hypothetical protein
MTLSYDNDRVQRVRNEREVKQSVPRTAVQSCLLCRRFVQIWCDAGACSETGRYTNQKWTCDQWQGRDKV